MNSMKIDPFGRGRIKELGVLVDHLKNDKRTQRRNFFSSLRDCIDSEAAAIIEFMNRNKELNQNPYMFVNSKGKILGYTDALAAALGITEDVRGKHYLDVFHFPDENQEKRASLKRYFSSTREISVPYERKDGKKTRKLTITKEEPVYTEKIKIKSLKSDKRVRTIAYVPIRVGPRKNSIKTFLSISPKDKKARKAELDKITINLFLNHGWPFDKTSAHMQEHGEAGLIAKYKALEKKAK